MVDRNKILSDLSKFAVDAMSTFSGVKEEIETIVSLRVNKIIKKMNIFFGYNVVDDIKLKTFEGEFKKIKEDKINNATKSKNIKQITNIKNDKIKKSLLELNKIFKSR